MAKTTKQTMTLEGFEALQRVLKKSPEIVLEHAKGAVSASTFSVASRMKATAPRLTGQLRNAISAKSPGLTGRVLIGPEAFYWRFLEYGTVKMAARPFIRPAGEAEEPVYIQRMRGIGPKLEREWNSTGGRFL